MAHWALFNFKLDMNKGFTLIELLVVIAIISVLSAIILFGITQYINKGKDSNVAGNLAVLIPAGEVYYNVENTANGDGYTGFCDSAVVNNAIAQMPSNPAGSCYESSSNPAGLCCHVDSDNNGDKWAACAREFSNPDSAYCVDSRGVKKEIQNVDCADNIIQCD
jgi:type II secretory pathway pseudopilin PulG